MEYKIPLILTPQPEGGWTVTSPLLPELITEGDSLDESLENVKDAFKAVMELYQELGRSLPENIQISDQKSLVWLEIFGICLVKYRDVSRKLTILGLSSTKEKEQRIASEIV